MKRSKHSLSFYRLATLNMGWLYPVGCVEVLPGDSFRHESAALIRVSPLVSPVMHPVHVQIHHWFVPNRILWGSWEDFITDIDSTETVPTVTMTAAHSSQLSIVQAMGVGLPSVSGAASVGLNALPFRAYNMIRNEFYRDQDLQAAWPEPNGDTDDISNYGMANVTWEKDYFTTARPYPQEGADTSVASLILSGQAPIDGLGVVNGNSDAAVTLRETGGGTSGPDLANTDATNPVRVRMDGTGWPTVYANLGEGTAEGQLDINEFRRSMAFQRIREHRNRFGKRYTDYLRFLGVTPSDARLQRPEYLGGGKQTISFSEVLSTAASGAAPLGSLGGHGISAIRTRPYRRFFEEHGHVISLLLVRPKSIYVNNVPRNFLRRLPSDYWQKELEMMGEQAVSNWETYYNAPAGANTFGYVQRYDEYRRMFSQVAGGMMTSPYYNWHFGRIFGSQPVLNESFVLCDPATRPFADTAGQQLQVMVSHRIAARRLVSKFARA